MTAWGVAAAGAAIAAIGSAGGTFAVRGLARRVGWVSEPNPIVPQHTRAVANLGGLGVAIGSAVGLAFAGAAGAEPTLPIGAMLGFLLFLGLGALDDRRPLGPVQKLLLQCAIAATVAPLGLTPALTGARGIDLALTIAVIVVGVNAVNLTDVCDGLVAGLAAVAFACWGLLDPSLLGPAWALAGACLGFLFWNRPPASIFLGDCGSLALGFALAALALVAADRRADALRLASGALACGVFLFELVFLVAVRAGKGVAFWRGSPDHFSLRLQARGFTRAQTDGLAWGAGLLFGLVALRLETAKPLERWGWLVLVLAAGALAARAILPWEVRAARAAADEGWIPRAGGESPSR